MYSPALRRTSKDDEFNGYEITAASMAVSGSDGLCMNCFTLKGDIKLTGIMLNKDTDPQLFNIIGE